MMISQCLDGIHIILLMTTDYIQLVFSQSQTNELNIVMLCQLSFRDVCMGSVNFPLNKKYYTFVW